MRSRLGKSEVIEGVWVAGWVAGESQGGSQGENRTQAPKVFANSTGQPTLLTHNKAIPHDNAPRCHTLLHIVSAVVVNIITSIVPTFQ